MVLRIKDRKEDNQSSTKSRMFLGTWHISDSGIGSYMNFLKYLYYYLHLLIHLYPPAHSKMNLKMRQTNQPFRGPLSLDHGNPGMAVQVLPNGETLLSPGKAQNELQRDPAIWVAGRGIQTRSGLLLSLSISPMASVS